MFVKTPLPDRVVDATEAARVVTSFSSDGTAVPRRVKEGVVKGSVIGVPM